MPPYDRGRTGETNSRKAAEAHHTLPPGWTPGRAFVRAGRPAMRSGIPAPPSLRDPASRAAKRAGNLLNHSRWTRLGFGPAALDVSRLPAPSACGGAGFAPTLNRHAWACRPTTATGVALPVVSARLPRRRADPVGRVRLAGLRLNALPRRTANGGSAAPRLRHLVSTTWLRACGLHQQPSPSQTAFSRLCRRLFVTPSQKTPVISVTIITETNAILVTPSRNSISHDNVLSLGIR